MKDKIKLGIILGAEFVAITLILLLIFFAGKKSYTVTFDLNGGTLISGELEQVVPQGKNATAPIVAKDGCYLHSWSASYHRVTRDIVVEAIWEWETSIGFDYASSENSNYCEIIGCFKDLVGDVYVGVYYDDKRVLGIREGAFKDCDSITYIHMLDGILSIGNNVFENCDSLVSVELPGTLAKLGSKAFANCKSLKEIVLPDELTTLGEQVFVGCTSLEKVVLPSGLKYIPAGAFQGCTSLKEIVIPASVEEIGEGAFAGCTSLENIVFEVETEEKKPEPTEDKKDEKGETDSPEEEIEIVYHGLVTICDQAFYGCTSLTEIVLPVTLENISANAFDSTLAVIRTPIAEIEKPEGWVDGWSAEATVEWGYVPAEEEPEEESEKHGWLS